LRIRDGSTEAARGAGTKDATTATTPSAGDTDDGEPTRVRANLFEFLDIVRREDPAADRVRTWPEASRQVFVNDDGRRIGVPVTLYTQVLDDSLRIAADKVGSELITIDHTSEGPSALTH
jgi:hypothetical protein